MTEALYFTANFPLITENKAPKNDAHKASTNPPNILRFYFKDNIQTDYND